MAAAFGTSARAGLPPGPVKRYGTANEPAVPPVSEGGLADGAGTGGGVKGNMEEGTKAATAAGEKGGEAVAAKKSKSAAAATATAAAGATAASGSAAPETATSTAEKEAQQQQHHGAAQDPNAPPKAASPTIFETAPQSGVDGGADAPRRPPRPARAAANHGSEIESNPLEAVLRMPAPSSRQAVHLSTPRYVHHFDTWSLVKQLAAAAPSLPRGFSEGQSITVMKTIRAQLNENMELARAGLVGKSDVENETYLFRAACSELRTEVGNNRKAENERMSSQRNQLQHEVDILGQRLGQDTSHLREEVKGMFDDRKMAVRMEQTSMESKV